MLSEEEELESRREAFEKMCEGDLFDLGGKKHYLAVQKIDDNSWEIIEFNKTNRLSIIKGKKARHSTLTFDRMDCLNLHKQRL